MEPLLPPLVAVAFAVAVPLGVSRLLRWTYPDATADALARRRAVRSFGSVHVAMSILWGAHGIGPTWAAHRFHPWSWLFAATVGLLALVFVVRMARVKRSPPPDGPAPAAPPLRGWVLGGTTAVGIVALPLALFFATDTTVADIHRVDETGARWRLRVDPWDGEALLASGWHARADDRLEDAATLVWAARRAGADEQARWILIAELRAAREDCAGARVAFQRSLEAQAARVFAQSVPTIRLGDYDLPPTLVTSCELTVGDIVGGDPDEPARIDLSREP